jgi:hypothetical protein
MQQMLDTHICLIFMLSFLLVEENALTKATLLSERLTVGSHAVKVDFLREPLFVMAKLLHSSCLY